MGYTRYWDRTKKKITPEFVIGVCEIIADCDDKGILIRNGWGEGNPIVTMDRICINGNKETDLDHESFCISNQDDEWEFCKTARKPYDYAVRQILKLAEEHGLVENVSSDGEEERIIADADYLRR